MTEQLINPYLELYDEVADRCKALGYDAYDYLPDSGTSYPFVFIGEATQDDILTKTKHRGTATIALHVFDHHDKRKTCQEMANTLYFEILKMERTEHFGWHVVKPQITVMFDNSDSTPLVHCVLDLQLEFT